MICTGSIVYQSIYIVDLVGICIIIRVANVVAIHNDLLTQ